MTAVAAVSTVITVVLLAVPAVLLAVPAVLIVGRWRRRSASTSDWLVTAVLFVGLFAVALLGVTPGGAATVLN